MESFPGDASNRHVIEAIRAGNNEEFFEAMESGKQMYNKYYAVLMLGGCCFRDWLMFYFFNNCSFWMLKLFLAKAPNHLTKITLNYMYMYIGYVLYIT